MAAISGQEIWMLERKTKDKAAFNKSIIMFSSTWDTKITIAPSVDKGRVLIRLLGTSPSSKD